MVYTFFSLASKRGFGSFRGLGGIISNGGGGGCWVVGAFFELSRRRGRSPNTLINIWLKLMKKHPHSIIMYLFSTKENVNNVVVLKSVFPTNFVIENTILKRKKNDTLVFKHFPGLNAFALVHKCTFQTKLNSCDVCKHKIRSSKQKDIRCIHTIKNLKQGKTFWKTSFCVSIQGNNKSRYEYISNLTVNNVIRRVTRYF